MGQRRPRSLHVLGLRVGDRVEVRSVGEILSTLDAAGTLDALPFMPEMLRFCGRRFTVFKRADKVNDTVERSGLRRLEHTVLLDEVRCDGAEHGGCQALCQILWKEAWLKRVPPGERPTRGHATAPHAAGGKESGTAGNAAPSDDRLARAAQRTTPEGETLFACQATEIRRASSYLAWWDPRQYVRDLRSGNVGIWEMARALGFWLFTLVVFHGRGFRLWRALYDAVQQSRGGDPFPFRQGTLTKTPGDRLDLGPGDIVEVKSYEAILATLNADNRNRGLLFDREMITYCGGRFKVLGRVERLIDPPSGRILTLANDCIILEGVTTKGDYHRFYPQNEYPLWREIWLQRVEDGGIADRKGDA